MSIKCTVTTSGTGFTVGISPTDNCTVADGVATVTDETAEASFSVEFTAASGYSITSIDYNNSSDVNVLNDGNNFAVSFNSYDPGSEPENTLAFTVVTSSNSGSGGDNPDQPSSNIQINISQNGTTTLATAGKFCNRNIDVNVDVSSSGGSSAELNITYSDTLTPPEDTSKLWIKASQPGSIEVSPKVMGESIINPGVADLIRPLGTITTGYNVTGFVCEAVGKKLYLMGGKGSGNATKQGFIFDTETHELVYKSSFLSSYKTGMLSAVVGSKIYMFGGGESNAVGKGLLIYDTETGGLTGQSTDMSFNGSSGAAVSVGTDIYLFNINTTNSSSVYVYDTLSSVIREINSVPFVISCRDPAVAIGNKIYLFFTGTSKKDIRVYDTVSGNVEVLSVQDSGNAAAIAAVGTKIYLFGGYSSGEISTIRVFDTEAKTLQKLNVVIPTPASNIYAAVIGNKIYLAGGTVYNKSTYAYDYINQIDEFILHSPLSEGNIQIIPDVVSNVFDLVPNQIKIGVKQAFIGDENNYAKPCAAYLHNGTKWIGVNDGLAYGFPITVTVENVSIASSSPTRIEYSGAATLTFTASDGFNLPDSVTVTGATSSWNKDTGTLSLSNPTGDVAVSVSGIESVTEN